MCILRYLNECIHKEPCVSSAFELILVPPISCILNFPIIFHISSHVCHDVFDVMTSWFFQRVSIPNLFASAVDDHGYLGYVYWKRRFLQCQCPLRPHHWRFNLSYLSIIQSLNVGYYMYITVYIYQLFSISWRSVLLVEKTTDLSQVTDKHYHILLHDCNLACI